VSEEEGRRKKEEGNGLCNGFNGGREEVNYL